MILTNNEGIPQLLYDRIQKDLHSYPYKRPKEAEQCFRVTELLSPPRPSALYYQYFDSDDLVIDAGFFVSMLFGTVLHEMCEGLDTATHKYETKVQKWFEVDGKKYLVSGTIDEINEVGDWLIVTDNKTCLVSNLAYDKEDYFWQLNIYRNLLQPNLASLGFSEDLPVSLWLRFFIKDLTASHKAKSIARTSPGSQDHQKALDLPDSPLTHMKVPSYSTDVIEKKITDSIRGFVNDPFRMCTSEERWDSVPSYAVMVRGKKRAVRVFSTEQEAVRHISTKLPAKDVLLSYVETRSPQPWERDKKCQYYCAAKSVCSYAKAQGYTTVLV